MRSSLIIITLLASVILMIRLTTAVKAPKAAKVVILQTEVCGEIASKVKKLECERQVEKWEEGNE